jgi:hypothetical protein
MQALQALCFGDMPICQYQIMAEFETQGYFE